MAFQMTALSDDEDAAWRDGAGLPGDFFCGSTLSHELGHNMGNAHDQACTPGDVVPYAYGYQSPNGTFPTRVTAGRLPAGQPIRTCGLGEPPAWRMNHGNAANLVRSMDEARLTVAHFRNVSRRQPQRRPQRQPRGSHSGNRPATPTQCDPHPDADAAAHADTDGHAHPHADADAGAYGHANRHPDAHPPAHAHACADGPAADVARPGPAHYPALGGRRATALLPAGERGRRLGRAVGRLQFGATQQALAGVLCITPTSSAQRGLRGAELRAISAVAVVVEHLLNAARLYTAQPSHKSLRVAEDSSFMCYTSADAFPRRWSVSILSTFAARPAQVNGLVRGGALIDRVGVAPGPTPRPTPASVRCRS
jgi:hypothetical protein